MWHHEFSKNQHELLPPNHFRAPTARKRLETVKDESDRHARRPAPRTAQPCSRKVARTAWNAGLLIRAGLSQEVARVTVAYSPFCIHTTSGVGYKEGRYKSIAQISEVLAFVGASDRPDDNGTPDDEPPLIRIPVDARLRMTGEYVLSNARGLDGPWNVRDSSGNRIAELSLLNGRLVGLSPVLCALGIGRRDVLYLHPCNEGFTASVERFGT